MRLRLIAEGTDSIDSQVTVILTKASEQLAQEAGDPAIVQEMATYIARMPKPILGTTSAHSGQTLDKPKIAELVNDLLKAMNDPPLIKHRHNIGYVFQTLTGSALAWNTLAEVVTKQAQQKIEKIGEILEIRIAPIELSHHIEKSLEPLGELVETCAEMRSVESYHDAFHLAQKVVGLCNRIRYYYSLDDDGLRHICKQIETAVFALGLEAQRKTVAVYHREIVDELATAIYNLTGKDKSVQIGRLELRPFYSQYPLPAISSHVGDKRYDEYYLDGMEHLTSLVHLIRLLNDTDGASQEQLVQLRELIKRVFTNGYRFRLI